MAFKTKLWWWLGVVTDIGEVVAIVANGHMMWQNVAAITEPQIAWHK
jgi:hypothetical protein